MKLNRTIPPNLKSIEQINFVAPKKYSITDNVPLYLMKEVPNETAQLDLYFDAGKVSGAKGLPGFVNGLLLSGTPTKSSTDINNDINTLGGFFESSVSMENSILSIYCLRENLIAILRTVIDAIKNVSFIEKEVDEYLSDKKQQHLISMEKVSYLAQRGFQKMLFSSNENYSNSIDLNDFDTISIADLKAFHNEFYLSGLTKVILVGNIDDKSIQHIVEECTPFSTNQKHIFEKKLTNTPGVNSINKKDAVQSAIRIGRILFNKKNQDDYLDFLVLNTILGDYFGSRLMTNIREDKGYTYGIGTMVAEFNETGYFMIATEVKNDVKEATLNEIRFEFERLQSELVSEDELALVKNYMLGQLLKSADGPHAMMDLFLSAEMHCLDLDHYNKAIDAINSVSPQRIRELAIKYLNWEAMSICLAG